MTARKFGLMLMGAVALAHPDAHAGAWLAPEEGQSIETRAIGVQDDRVFYEQQIYLERPLGDRFAIVAKPLIVSGGANVLTGYKVEAEGGLKTALLRSPNATISVQASALWRSDGLYDACGQGGGELRAMGGASFEGGRSFLNVEAGVRSVGGCDIGRFDVAVGRRIADRAMGMLEASVYAPRDEVGVLKLQASVLHLGVQREAVQIGVRVRLDPRGSETALVVSLWGPLER
ncbi:MAG: hypothetical protein ABW199_06705 [Caulobacterales bacterium]